MVDKIAKDLFEKYSAGCAEMEVAKDGRILKANQIAVDAIEIDKTGKISVVWWDRQFSDRHRAPLNEAKSCWARHIEGVFSDESRAAGCAARCFSELKKERIAALEAELARIKSED